MSFTLIRVVWPGCFFRLYQCCAQFVREIWSDFGSLYLTSSRLCCCDAVVWEQTASSPGDLSQNGNGDLAVASAADRLVLGMDETQMEQKQQQQPDSSNKGDQNLKKKCLEVLTALGLDKNILILWWSPGEDLKFIRDDNMRNVKSLR